MTRWEHISDAHVLRAGQGEWYNQRHDKQWDMGEDAQELQPPRWHLEMEQAFESPKILARVIVADLSEMEWLVGQDWGFLIRLGERAMSVGVELVVVAQERVARAAETIGLGEHVQIVENLGDAL